MQLGYHGGRPGASVLPQVDDRHLAGTVALSPRGSASAAQRVHTGITVEVEPDLNVLCVAALVVGLGVLALVSFAAARLCHRAGAPAPAAGA